MREGFKFIAQKDEVHTLNRQQNVNAFSFKSTQILCLEFHLGEREKKNCRLRYHMMRRSTGTARRE